MQQKTKSTIKRFTKVLIGAFVAGAVMVQFQDYQSIQGYLNALLTAGISGVLLALQKFISWK